LIIGERHLMSALKRLVGASSTQRPFADRLPRRLQPVERTPLVI
jgi:hypothetical protein